MANFSFQVDREHKVVAPITVYPDVALKGEPYTLEPGEVVVYRGLIEIDDMARWTFFLKDGRKAFATKREQLEQGLEENYDALPQIL